MEALIARYGLLAVAIGAGVEGEPFAVAGGILAQHGLLRWWAAGLAAIAGALWVDQLWFQLARRHRDGRWVRRIAERPAFARALDLLERRRAAFLLLFRFAYGVRAVAPVAIGWSRVPARAFVVLEAAAAIVWGAGFTAIGWAAGPPFERLSARYGGMVEAAALILSAAAIAFALRRGPRRG